MICMKIKVVVCAETHYQVCVLFVELVPIERKPTYKEAVRCTSGFELVTEACDRHSHQCMQHKMGVKKEIPQLKCEHIEQVCRRDLN